MPSPFDALLAIIGSAQAAKSSLSQWADESARKARASEYASGIPEAYTAPSVGDLPMAGVINPVTAGAHAQWPKLAKLIADKLDEAAGLGMGHRTLSFLQKHPRSVNIYDEWKGPGRGETLIPQAPSLPLIVHGKDLPTLEHELGHATTVFAGQPDIAPPGLAPTLSGHLNQLLGRSLGHYSAAELPGELYPNLFNDLTKVTDKPAFAKWLWDATDLANAPHVKWGESPRTLKKVWEGNAFYETDPGLGFSWKAGDLTDPALRAKSIPKEFTGFFNPETNFGGYGIDLPNQPFHPDLLHFELLQNIRNKLRAAEDFDRPIQDLIDLDRHAKVRVGPQADILYGGKGGPDDFTLIPRFRQADMSNELAKRRAGNQTRSEIDSVMSTLRELNLIDPERKPTYVSDFYEPHGGSR